MPSAMQIAQTPRPETKTSASRPYAPELTDVLRILSVGASIDATARSLAALFKVQSPIPILHVLKLAGWDPSTSKPTDPLEFARPRKPTQYYQTPKRTIANMERVINAAYIRDGVLRMQKTRGMSREDAQAALQKERRYAAMHRLARNERKFASDRLEIASRAHGPVLGWYTMNDGRVESRCRKLAGHNFNVTRPMPAGYPGTIHPQCRCWAGPAWSKGVLLN